MCIHRLLLIVLAVAGLLTRNADASRRALSGQDEDRFREAWGERYRSSDRSRSPRDHSRAGDAVRRWNAMALDANALDHTPVATGEARRFGEQLGPGRTSRALAIVHIAMFDAVNAVTGAYQGYTAIPRAIGRTSIDAAIAQAAHDTLIELYPSQSAAFDTQLAEDLAAVHDRPATAAGSEVGRGAARAILALRANDGSQTPEPRLGIGFFTSDQPGAWRQDPVGRSLLALGAFWGQVTPFVTGSASTLTPQPPPALESAEYASAFDDVKRLGGDGIVTATERTADQTLAGIFWAYDGTPGLGTPPRLYNQIALTIADQRRTGQVELARMLALVNVAMADVAIACWEEKYVFQFWRPVTGIREADPGTGPTGLGDGNPLTIGDPSFTPLGAPATNLTGPNFTPPFPAYASGHSAFGSALFQVLRRFYGTDRIPFTFVSDELNGVNTDNTGQVRPRVPRRFPSLEAAELENGRSRIYLGIHWEFDNTRGLTSGRYTADHVIDHAFLPARRR